MATRLSDADRSLSELAGITRSLPNPHLLIAPFVRREAVLSSRIEGTQASLSDLFFAEAGGAPTSRIGDVLEVSNYVRALEHGLARLTELPLSLRLLGEMHAELMRGVRGEHLTPGEFRRSQNWIGPSGSALNEAVFVPPPVPEMHEALAALELYLHSGVELPPLVRLALVHYQFEAIHPFLDGNGRMGRLLLTLILCAERILPQPVLYLSAYFERHRDEYYRLLLAVSERGAWANWIEFFLAGVAEQSRDAVERGRQLLELREEYRTRLQRGHASALPLRLVDSLFLRPALSITQAARILGVTYVAGKRNVGKLVHAGILEEASGQLRNRIFVSREILLILEAPDAGIAGTPEAPLRLSASPAPPRSSP